MKKLLTAVFLIAGLNSIAQNNPVQQVTGLESASSVYSKNIITPDNSVISPNYSLTPPKQHLLLRGLVKTVVVGAITYQFQKSSISGFNKGSFSRQQTTQFLPSLGVGLAVGLPDIIHSFKAKKISKVLPEKVESIVPVQSAAKPVFIGDIAEAMDVSEPADYCLGGGGNACGCQSAYTVCVAHATAVCVAATEGCALLGPFAPACEAGVLAVFAISLLDCDSDRTSCQNSCH